MTENQNTPRQPDRLDNAFELVSRQIDGDLSEAETSELAAMEAKSPAEVADFRQQCLGIQAMLRQIPLRKAELSPGSGSWAAAAAPVPSRGRTGVVWGSMTAVIAACLLLVILRQSEVPSSATTDQSIAANSPSPKSRFHAESVSPAASAEIADASAKLAEAGGLAGTPVPGLNDKTSDTPEDSSIRTLLESSDWNIVVVKLQSKDRGAAMEQIQSAIQQLGFHVHNSTGNAQSDFLGVVMTSAVSQNEALIRSVSQGVSASPAESDQNNLTQTRREEIQAAIRNSLGSPTGSELHHGQVYLALSTGGNGNDSSAGLNLAASTAAAAPEAASAVPQETVVADAGQEAARSRQSDATAAVGSADSKIASRSVSGLTVVVFEFDDSEALKDASSANKQI